ncbi:hypothetical protein ARMSODRAFT_978674 [Armillaria solidipes]|uniref:Uncharacterized protein n=1 Tax=Armillaria solidipes TaxID=1076256 RepID=A0A2H3BK98_9AGAR|nr:hypothetical protein ARMSODRAFT_978674 [Armillaria solidipes]
MATILQAFVLVSILAPNSLEVGPALPKDTSISVPTVIFSKSNLSETHCDYYPSPAWERVLGHALQSDTLIGWNVPVGHGFECNYMVQYLAPGLQCTELGMDEVNTMLWQNIHFPATVYDATYNLTDPSTGANLSMVWHMYHADGKSTAAGACCLLYNTTQQSVVSFVNNTRIISPSIISYNAKYHFEPSFACGAVHGRNPLYPELASFLTIVAWLYNQLNRSILYSLPNSTVQNWFSGTKLMTSTSLFLINQTVRTFTPNSENVSRALEQILVNVMVAMITSMGHTTMVNASMAQDELIWVYHVQRLWIIYATALAVTAVCGAVRLACILKNGEDSNLTFWDIVWATRNSELDVVEREKLGDAVKETMLQYAVQGRDSDMNTSGVFALTRSRH